jgi:hypothetical protein
MNFLFWNINKKPLQEAIQLLARERLVDIIILAECEIDDVVLLETLNEGRHPKYGTVPNYALTRRLKIFSLLPFESFRPLRDEGNSMFYLLTPPVGEQVILVAAHLSSKMHQDETEQALNITRLKDLILEVENEIGHTKTIIVGDLNMNPFEAGMVAADTLHGVMTRDIASKVSRRVEGVEKKFFYNPMWGRFGDNTNGPPGSYYYNKGGQMNFFWNIFDQVLIRPELMSNFVDSDLEIISQIEGVPLLSANGLPNKDLFSDHLPLFFTLKI